MPHTPPPPVDGTPLLPVKSAYKVSEKRFKKLNDVQIRADSDVLDVHALRDDQRAKVSAIGTWKWRSAIDGSERERPVLAFTGYGAAHHGFYVIPDAIDAATQLDIAHRCLTEYIEAPHVTNMHQQNDQVADLWRKARTSHPRDPSKSPALGKLHWGAAGYHYDWTARKYYPENFSSVPLLLSEIGASCAKVCGESLRGEAVIVNFYKANSTMGGHQDDVEYTMDHPVVSLSLGSHCVFLKGTTTKEDLPLEVLLRSGDLAVLGGASRLSYHGIAKVLPTEFAITEQELESLVAKKTADDKELVEDKEEGTLRAEDEWREDLRAVRRYVETHRLNINIRQVYADEAPPSSSTSELPPPATIAEENVSKRQKVQ